MLSIVLLELTLPSPGMASSRMTMDACHDLVHITQRRHQLLERRPRRRVALEAVVGDGQESVPRRRRADDARRDFSTKHAKRADLDALDQPLRRRRELAVVEGRAEVPELRRAR